MLRAECTANGIVLIFDEIVAFRVGHGGRADSLQHPPLTLAGISIENARGSQQIADSVSPMARWGAGLSWAGQARPDHPRQSDRRRD